MKVPSERPAPSAVRIRFIGSGDAFGDGGRFQACILLEHGGFRALLDCGTSSLVAMKQQGIDPGTIDTVLITHFHGDHAGGVPSLILDGQFGKRMKPLVIAGPRTVQRRIEEMGEALLPTSSLTRQAFAVAFLELTERPIQLGPLSVTAIPVEHLPETVPHGLRVHVVGRTLAYTGDTQWCDAIVALAHGADLLIAEAYSIDKKIPYHLSARDLLVHREEITASRIVLTHAGTETLARRSELLWQLADDGTELRLD